MRIRLVAVAALMLAISACSSSPSKPAESTTSVSPISDQDLAKVVRVICLEPTAGMAHVIDGIQDASPARMNRVLGQMAVQCPDRLEDLSDYNEARLN